MIVLDSSALMALLLNEAGADVVLAVIGKSVMSTVNLSETMEKALTNGLSAEVAMEPIRRSSIDILPFEVDHALAAAQLRAATRHRGLSLGDRACLALGKTLDAPVLTADRAWADLDIGIDIRLIR